MDTAIFYSAHASVFLLMAFAIVQWMRPQGFSKLLMAAAVFLKLLMALLYGYLLLQYYPGKNDSWSLYADSLYLNGIREGNPEMFWNFFWNSPDLFHDLSTERKWTQFAFSLQNPDARAVFFTKFGSLLLWATDKNYWLSSIYLSFISFAGVAIFCKTICRYFSLSPLACILGFSLVPSVAFWSSGFSKETLLFLGFFTALSIFIYLYVNGFKSKWNLLLLPLALLCLALVFRIKYYYLVASMPFLVLLLCERLLRWYAPAMPGKKRWGLSLACFVLFGVLGSFAHPNLGFGKVAGSIQENHHSIYPYAKPENRIEYASAESANQWLLVNMPKALAVSIFLPFPWEEGVPLKKLIGLEQLLFLLLLGNYLYLLFKRKLALPESAFLYALLSFSVFLGTLLALSCPELGNLIRYKTLYMCLLWALLLHVHLPRWLQWMGKFKKK